jgi:hypothetical protein
MQLRLLVPVFLQRSLLLVFSKTRRGFVAPLTGNIGGLWRVVYHFGTSMETAVGHRAVVFKGVEPLGERRNPGTSDGSAVPASRLILLCPSPPHASDGCTIITGTIAAATTNRTTLPILLIFLITAVDRLDRQLRALSVFKSTLCDQILVQASHPSSSQRLQSMWGTCKR